jgi:hypothetical protein
MGQGRILPPLRLYNQPVQPPQPFNYRVAADGRHLSGALPLPEERASSSSPAQIPA